MPLPPLTPLIALLLWAPTDDPTPAAPPALSRAEAPYELEADVTVLGEDRADLLAKLFDAARLLDQAHSRQTEPGGLFPEDLTAEEFDTWIEQHPDREGMLLAPLTVVRRDADDGLLAVPYSEAFAEPLGDAADRLIEAAALIDERALGDDASLQRALASRADALLTDSYEAADRDLLAATGSDLFVVLGPRSTALDTLTGNKRAFEALVALVDREVDAEIAAWRDRVDDLHAAIPVEAGLLAAGPRLVDVRWSVVNDVYRGGHLARRGDGVLHFPSDASLRADTGRLTVFSRNLLQAWARRVLAPAIESVLDPALAELVSPRASFDLTVAHYLGHRLGPERVVDDPASVRQALGPDYRAFEEACADALGLFALEWLRSSQLPTGAAPDEVATTFVARAVHALASTRAGRLPAFVGDAAALLLEAYRQRGAVTRDGTHLDVDVDAFAAATPQVVAELVTIAAHGRADEARRHLARGRELADAWATLVDRVAAAEPSRLTPVEARPD